MTMFMHNVPDFIWNNSRYFLYMSNELEMDRIKQETSKRAAQTEANASANRRMGQIMQRRKQFRK